MDNTVLIGIGTVVGAAVASFVANRAGSKPSQKVAHQLLKAEGENGDATVLQKINEIHNDVRDTRDLASQVKGRFDGLDRKVDGLVERVSKLEYVTGLRSNGRN